MTTEAPVLIQDNVPATLSPAVTDALMPDNPYVPLALVYALAQVTPERNKLPAGFLHITAVIHQGRSFDPMRFQIDPKNGGHWDEFVGHVIGRIKPGETDTITVFYPASDDSNVDMGVMLSADAEPMYLTWTHGPHFQLAVNGADAAKSLENAVGVANFQSLIRR